VYASDDRAPEVEVDLPARFSTIRDASCSSTSSRARDESCFLTDGQLGAGADGSTIRPVGTLE
jgi:hypothetical protein